MQDRCYWGGLLRQSSSCHLFHITFAFYKPKKTSQNVPLFVLQLVSSKLLLMTWTPRSNSSYLARPVYGSESSKVPKHFTHWYIKGSRTSAGHCEYLRCLAAEENDSLSSCASLRKSNWTAIKNWYPNFWAHVLSHMNDLCCFKKCFSKLPGPGGKPPLACYFFSKIPVPKASSQQPWLFTVSSDKSAAKSFVLSHIYFDSDTYQLWPFLAVSPCPPGLHSNCRFANHVLITHPSNH